MAAAMILMPACSKPKARVQDANSTVQGSPSPVRTIVRKASPLPRRTAATRTTTGPADKAATGPAETPASQPEESVAVPAADPPVPPELAAKLEAGWQVAEVQVAGVVVQVRVEVYDPEKARCVLGPGVERSLEDAATGKVLKPPASARFAIARPQNRSGSVRMYLLQFDNSGGVVKPGSRVALVLDDARVEDLQVK